MARRAAHRVADTIWDEPTSGWRGTLALGARVGLLLAVFVVLDRWLAQVTRLPEAAYFEPVIVVAWLRSLGPLQLSVLVGASALVAYLGGGRLTHGWNTLENGRTLRLFVALVLGLLAWWFSTLDANPYFGRFHLVDRLLLVASVPLVVWRPAFVLPFLFVLLPFNAQFHHPLGGHSVAQVSLPTHVLLLFGAAHLVWVVTGRQTMRGFVFLALCLIAASYFDPGVGKLRLGWLSHRHVYLMVFASYSVGWLGFLDPSSVTALGEVMAFLDWPIVLATLVIECGTLVLMWRRGTALAWLVGFVGLNTLIWLTSGIFFWTWIVMNATLLVLLWRRGTLPVFQVFSRPHFALSIPIILAGSVLFRPARLAWLDAPINYSYRLEATTSAGERFALSTDLLAPYDTHFALSNFGALVDDAQLGIVWGAAYDIQTVTALLEARTAADVFAVERERGANAYDPEAAERFDVFITTVVDRHNRGSSGRNRLRWLKAPPQVWTFDPGAPRTWPGPEPVVSVTVRQVLTFFDGERYRVLRRTPIREIPVEPRREGRRGEGGP